MDEKYRILLVEDDDIICEQIEKHLLSWGYEVCGITGVCLIMDLHCT